MKSKDPALASRNANTSKKTKDGKRKKKRVKSSISSPNDAAGNSNSAAANPTQLSDDERMLERASENATPKDSKDSTRQKVRKKRRRSEAVTSSLEILHEKKGSKLVYDDPEGEKPSGKEENPSMSAPIQSNKASAKNSEDKGSNAGGDEDSIRKAKRRKKKQSRNGDASHSLGHGSGTAEFENRDDRDMTRSQKRLEPREKDGGVSNEAHACSPNIECRQTGDDSDFFETQHNENVVDNVADVRDDPLKKEGVEKEDDPRLPRTLYVGNVSQDAKQKDIKKLFQPFGSIETVRIRGVIPVNPRIPKKAALLTNQLAPFSDSFHAYVVFKESDDVAKVMQVACEKLNMSVFMDRHIRVMPAAHKTNGSRRHSLFLGNLPFDCSEEDIIRTFQDIAAKLGVEVINARVNRDGDTGIGRGIGFVTFNDILGVQGCLNAAGEVKLGGRVIRMEPASKSKKLNTKTHRKQWRERGKPQSAQLYWQGAGSTYMAGRSQNSNYRQNARTGGRVVGSR